MRGSQIQKSDSDTIPKLDFSGVGLAYHETHRRNIMNQMRNFFSRFRLIGSLLALAVVLSALAVTPVSATECETGCIHWIKGIGCIDCQFCCVTNGQTTCGHDYDNTDCGTSGWVD